MALVRQIVESPVSAGRHLPVSCTFAIVEVDGVKHLQIDTYGSEARKLRGKKSQSLRFAPEAIEHLKKIVSDNNL